MTGAFIVDERVFMSDDTRDGAVDALLLRWLCIDQWMCLLYWTESTYSGCGGTTFVPSLTSASVSSATE